MGQQVVVFGALVGALALFAWGRWRHDVVAVLALVALTIAGPIPAAEAFHGFGHPAVITVAAVLIISRSVINSGLSAVLSGWLAKLGKGLTLQVGVLTVLVALLSCFMNNIGALALLMPVAIQSARRGGHPPSLVLMPLAFASLLGGLVTMIGTPPNIIIALFREGTAAGRPFGMFDFSPAGSAVAGAGLLFIVLAGWRLLPHRKGAASSEDLFHIEDYLTEVQVGEGSPLVGERISALPLPEAIDPTVIGIVRGGRYLVARARYEPIQAGDHLVVRADPESLEGFLRWGKLELAEKKKLGRKDLGSDEVLVVEAVVADGSTLVGNSAVRFNLRGRFGITLLALSRAGERVARRLGKIPLRAGDVLLLNGPGDSIHETLKELGCLPLAGRDLKLGTPRRILSNTALFGAAILLAATGLLPVQVAFVGAAVAMVLTGLISPREIYRSVDWPVVVLLGAMLPLGSAFETSGAAASLAGLLTGLTGGLPPGIALGALMGVTIVLTGVVNNAAAAVLMAPIALTLAGELGVSADPFLMAVALGSSAGFLTPIAHQSNTLVMGPGGYHFVDFLRLGVPLALLVLAVGVPALLLFWPL